MADLAEITTGTAMDAPKVVDPTPILAAGSTASAAAPAAAPATLGFLDKAKNAFGSAKTNVTSSAQKAAAAASDNMGLMWLIMAAMVAAGLLLFTAKGKGKGKGSFFNLSGGRKPSGGSFARK